MRTFRNEPLRLASSGTLEVLESFAIKGFTEAAAITLTEHVANRSVAVLSRERGGLYVGSGVCIRIGDHYLAATAKHNLQDEGRNLTISDFEVRPRGERFGEPLEVQSFGTAPSLDLAWLEFSPEASIRRRVVFVGADEIDLVKDDEEERACFLLGYPAEMAEISPDAQQRPLLCSTCVGTVSIPSLRRRSPQAPNTFVVQWPPHDRSLDESLPKPHGVSGGGVWLLPRHDDYLVWSPERAKLVGIETSWWEDHRELVAVPMMCWLELVASQIPKLKQEAARILERIRSGN